MKQMKRILFTMVMCAMFMGSTKAYAADTLIQAGMSQDTAVDWEYGVDYVSRFDKKDTQWFKIEPKQADGFYNLEVKNYNITTGGNSHYGFCIDVYTAWEEKLYSFDVRTNDKYNFRFKLEDKSQVYYIKFYMGEGSVGSDDVIGGNYHTKLDFAKDDVADTISNAVSIKTETTVKANMNGSTMVKSNWEHKESSDVDWFKFTAKYTDTYVFTLTDHNITDGNNDYHMLNSGIYTEYEETLLTTSAKQNFPSTTELELEAGQTYFIKVCVGDGQWLSTGKYSINISSKTYTEAIKKPQLISVKQSKKNIVISFKKSIEVKEYAIYRATSKNGKYEKIATTKTGKYTDNKVTSGKTYYYKIVATKDDNGQALGKKASYSSVKSVKFK